MKLKRYSLLVVVIIGMLLACVTSVSATTIKDVSNGYMRVGRDVYSASSPNLTPLNIIKTIQDGGSVVYTKFSGRWYNVANVTSPMDLFSTSKAETISSIYGWSNRKWYLPTTEIDYFGPNITTVADNQNVTLTGSGIEWTVSSSDTNPIGSFSFTFDKKLKYSSAADASIKINGLPATSEQAEIINAIFNKFTTADNKTLTGNIASNASSIKTALDTLFGIVPDGTGKITLEFTIMEDATGTDHPDTPGTSELTLIIN